VPHVRAVPLILALLALLALAGCGKSGSKKETLDQAQQKRFDTSIDDFLAAGTNFILDVRRCARRSGRATCVKQRTGALNASADKTRATIADLQRGVTGGCATQLNLAAGRVTSALDVLLPLGGAARTGNVRRTRRLTNRVVDQLRPLATTVRAERRACKS
jgi:predicted small lipoprotein YifL